MDLILLIVALLSLASVFFNVITYILQDKYFKIISREQLEQNEAIQELRERFPKK